MSTNGTKGRTTHSTPASADLTTTPSEGDKHADAKVTEDDDNGVIFFGVDAFFTDFLTSKLWPYMAISM
jgi:hypothetical protein